MSLQPPVSTGSFFIFIYWSMYCFECHPVRWRKAHWWHDVRKNITVIHVNWRSSKNSKRIMLLNERSGGTQESAFSTECWTRLCGQATSICCLNFASSFTILPLNCDRILVRRPCVSTVVNWCPRLKLIDWRPQSDNYFPSILFFRPVDIATELWRFSSNPNISKEFSSRSTLILVWRTPNHSVMSPASARFLTKKRFSSWWDRSFVYEVSISMNNIGGSFDWHYVMATRMMCKRSLITLNVTTAMERQIFSPWGRCFGKWADLHKQRIMFHVCWRNYQKIIRMSVTAIVRWAHLLTIKVTIDPV